MLAVSEGSFMRQLENERVEGVDKPPEGRAPVARPAPVGGEDQPRVRFASVKGEASQWTEIDHVLRDDGAALHSPRVENHRVRSTHEIGPIQYGRRVMPELAQGCGHPSRPHLVEKQLQARS